METKRLFLGTFIDKNIFDDIYYELEAEFSEFTSGKWVNLKYIHFTYKFLGDVAESELPIVTSIISDVLGNYKSDMIIKGIGVFPNINKPRVLYASIDNPDQLLTRLHKKIENKLSQIGFEKDSRRFTPHITLQRIKEMPSQGFRNIIDSYSGHIFGRMSNFSVNLIESVMTKSGPEYRIVK